MVSLSIVQRGVRSAKYQGDRLFGQNPTYRVGKGIVISTPAVTTTELGAGEGEGQVLVRSGLSLRTKGGEGTIYLPLRGLGSPQVRAICDHIREDELLNNTVIRMLDVHGNNICDAGAEDLADLLVANPEVTGVNVAENEIGSRGLEALIDSAVNSSTITVLNLDGNPGLQVLPPARLTMLAEVLKLNRAPQALRVAKAKAARRQQAILARSTLSPCQISDVHVAIIGGGIGGLALAIALRQRHVRCTVFEKDASFDVRRQGYGLTLQQGSRSLARLGVGADVAAASTYSSSHWVFDQGGGVLAFWGALFDRKLSCSQRGLQESVEARRAKEDGEDSEGEKGSPKRGSGTSPSKEQKNSGPQLGRNNFHIPRQALRDILLKALPPDTVVWGAPISHLAPVLQSPARSVKDGGDYEGPSRRGVDVHFDSDRPNFRATVVVACDGIHSRVRRQLVGDPLRYLGYLVILGIAKSASMPLCKDRIFQTSDGSARIFVMPFSATEHMWQLSFQLSEDVALHLARHPDELRQAALDRCKGWHSPVPELLASTPPSATSGYPAYDRPPPSTSTSSLHSLLGSECGGLVTLLGDAAHCMSPFKGQGANQALLDAVVFAESLHRQFSLRDWTHQPGLPNDKDVVIEPDGDSELQLDPVAVKAARACRAYEEEMLSRTSPKVLDSFNAVSMLHSPNFLLPTFHVGRKSQGTKTLEKVNRMRELKVGSWDAESGRLDQLACSLNEELLN